MDVFSFRAVIIILGLISLGTAAGIIYLALQSKPVPNDLSTALGASIGALTGILVQFSRPIQEPQRPAERIIQP